MLTTGPASGRRDRAGLDEPSSLTRRPPRRHLGRARDCSHTRECHARAAPGPPPERHRSSRSTSHPSGLMPHRHRPWRRHGIDGRRDGVSLRCLSRWCGGAAVCGHGSPFRAAGIAAVPRCQLDRRQSLEALQGTTPGAPSRQLSQTKRHDTVSPERRHKSLRRARGRRHPPPSSIAPWNCKS